MSTDTTAMKHGIYILRKTAKISSNEDYKSGILYAAQYLEDVELAKEKEQIVKSYQQGINDGEYPALPGMGEIYYENTYQ